MLSALAALAEHGDSLVHEHDESCSVSVRQIFPRGGPYEGNTAVTVTGYAFQDVGDIKCRFGVDEVEAQLVTTRTERAVINPRGRSFADQTVHENVTVIECASPGCTSPTCLPAAHVLEVAVPLEVSMNGITFSGSGLQFTYYDASAVHVSLLTPRGGPLRGDTRVLVHGMGFKDLGSGVNGVTTQGFKCKFGENDMVNATKPWGDRFSARCVAPTDVNFEDAPGMEGRLNTTLRALPLELTFNGYDAPGTLTASAVPYTYYDEFSLNVSRLHPLGGPSAGGTQLTVYLADDSLLIDLGGGARGLYCRFSYTEPVSELSHEGVALRHVVVNASLADCAGARACGGGGGALQCVAPPYAGPLCDGPVAAPACADARNVTVEVALNGQQFSGSGVAYEYYDEAVWALHSLAPRGGPLGGNTSLVLSGMRLKDLGDVRCRFSQANPEADAEVVHGTINAAVASGRLERPCGCEALLDRFCDHAGPPAGAPPNPYEAAAPGACQACAAYAQREDCAAAGLPAAGAEDCKRWCFPRQHVLAERTFAMAHASGARVGTQTVEVEVTLNGQDYLPARAHATSFSYFALDAAPHGLSVASLSPRGGPSLGGTRVRVNGTGFHDYGGTGAEGAGGLWCKWGGLPHVRATRDGAGHLLCVAPPLDGLSATTPTASRAVEVTLNGQLRALTSAGVEFEYYLPGSLKVSKVYPRGGPRAGGVPVTVWGSGFRDLDHGDGLYCQFGASALVPATLQSTAPQTVETAAFAGAQLAPDGQRLTCPAPALPAAASCASVPVRVTLNGDNPSDAEGTARSQPCCEPPTGEHFAEDVLFAYYDPYDAGRAGTGAPPSTPHMLPGDSGAPGGRWSPEYGPPDDPPDDYYP